MGVEAARAALHRLGDQGGCPASCWFATSHPPLMDKGNASSIAAAIGLSDDAGADHIGGSIRSGFAALRAAASLAEPSLTVLSDMRCGRPGSDDEVNGGDAAAAFAFGPDACAEIAATASVSSPVMDRWRSEGDVGTTTWDDRWVAEHQVPLMERAAGEALKRAGLAIGDIAAVVVSAPSQRVEASVLARLGSQVPNDSRSRIGYTGTADVGLRLAAAARCSVAWPAPPRCHRRRRRRRARDPDHAANRGDSTSHV